MPQYDVLDASGSKVGVVDAADVGRLPAGYSVATAAQSQAFREEEAYGGYGGTLATGALGLAHGLTLGGSTALLGQTGLRGDIRKLQQANPLAFGAGDIIGGIGGAALSFTPAGMAARAGLRAAGAAGARGAGLAGRFAAGGAVEGALVGAGEGLARASLNDDLNGEKMAAAIAAGTITGGVFGGGIGAIGQVGIRGAQAAKAAVARRAAALREAGTAAYGAAAPVVRRGAGVARRAFQDGADYLSDQIAKPGRQAMQDVVDGVYDNAAAKLADDAADMYAGGAAAFSGKDREAIRKGVMGGTPEDVAARKVLQDRDAAMAAHVDELTDNIGANEEAWREVGEQIRKLSLKQKNLEKIMRDVDGDTARVQAEALIGEVLAETRKMRGRSWQRRDPNLHSEVGDLDTGYWEVDKGLRGAHNQKDLKRLEEAAYGILERAKRTDAPGNPNRAALWMRTVDEVKRELGSITRDAKRLAERSYGYARGNTGAALETMYQRTRLALEDPRVWGANAASAQREINKHLTLALSTGSEFSSDFLAKFGADPNNAWAKGIIADPGSIAAYVDSLGMPKNRLSERALRETMESRRLSVESISRHFDLDPKARAAVEKALRTTDAVLNIDSQAAKDVVRLNQLMGLRKVNGGGGMGVVAGAALATGLGPLGAAAVVPLLDPATVVAQRAALEAMARKYDIKIDEGVRAMFEDIVSKPGVQQAAGAAKDVATFAKAEARAAAKEAKLFAKDAADMGRAAAGRARDAAKTAVAAGRREITAVGEELKEYGAAAARSQVRRAIKTVGAAKRYHDTREEFNERSRKLLSFADDIPMMKAQLTDALSPLTSGAPKAQAAALMAAVRAVEYLDAKLPGIRTVPHPFGRAPTVSLLEAERWLKRAAAVADPAMLLNDMAKGKLSRESVDAVKNVYPRMFEELQYRVMAKVVQIDSRGQTIPYPKRKQLGILLEVPTDGTLQPQVIEQIMNSYGIAKEKDAKSKKANRAPRPKSQSLAAAFSTDTQRMEATA